MTTGEQRAKVLSYLADRIAIAKAAGGNAEEIAERLLILMALSATDPGEQRRSAKEGAI